ncbi:hypothetical protein F5877DRAFT_77649 [Lentinula edodes]|nr:hypothetical protein F5877DRAFT_77649 [Lentinula edodes]
MINLNHNSTDAKLTYTYSNIRQTRTNFAGHATRDQRETIRDSTSAKERNYLYTTPPPGLARRVFLDARGGDAPSGSASDKPDPPKVDLSESPALAKHLQLMKNLRNKPYFPMGSGVPRVGGQMPRPNDASGDPQSSGSNKHARRDTFNARDAGSATSGSEGFPLISSTKTPPESAFARDGSNPSTGPHTGGTTNDNPKNPVRSASSSDLSLSSSSGSPAASNAGPTDPAESVLPYCGHLIRSYGEDLD